jgi:A/G-specific adenine glycosylase
VRQIVASQSSCRRRGNESQPALRSWHSRIQSEPPHVVSYKFPETFEDVFALPGIGRYTAGAICSIAFNQPTPVLDGNVIRVLTRIFGIEGDPREKKTNAKLWQVATELVTHASRITHHASRLDSTRTKDEDESEVRSPKSEIRNSRNSSSVTVTGSCSALNQSVMELGALVCTPRSPKCPHCPARRLCVAFREGRQEELPNLGQRRPATKRRFIAFVIERNRRFLVRQRPADVVNAHLWEFPNVEFAGSDFRSPTFRRNPVIDSADRLKAELQTNMPCRATGLRMIDEKPFCTIRHSITRYRITLEAWRAELNGQTKYVSGRWFAPAQLNKLAFTAAHRNILRRLLERDLQWAGRLRRTR